MWYYVRMDIPKGWLTSKQAALRIGITQQSVRNAGEPSGNRPAAIRTMRFPGCTLFNEKDVEAYKRRAKKEAAK